MAAPPRSSPEPARRRPASRPAQSRPGKARGGQGSAVAGGSLSRRLRVAITDLHWRRWMAVLICVAVLLVGVPLAHALVGDLGALLLLVGLGGFALGRSTAKVGAVPPRKGKGR